MDYKKLPSGATLGLQIAEFDDGVELWQTIGRELIGAKALPTANLQDISLDSVRALIGQDVNNLADVILKLLSSKTLEAVVRKCAASCIYIKKGAPEESGLRIDRTTFRDAEARGDYIPVLWEVTLFNVAPFFANLSSLLTLLPAANPGSAQR